MLGHGPEEQREGAGNGRKAGPESRRRFVGVTFFVPRSELGAGRAGWALPRKGVVAKAAWSVLASPRRRLAGRYRAPEPGARHGEDGSPGMGVVPITARRPSKDPLPRKGTETVGVTMKGPIHSRRMSPAPEAPCHSREEGGSVGGTWVPPRRLGEALF